MSTVSGGSDGREARGPGTGRAGRRVASRVLVEPVREGRLRSVGWPPGLGAVVGSGAAICGLMIVLTLASGLIRRHADLAYATPDSTLPRTTLPLLVVALVFALGCLYAAALHVRLLVRIPVVVVVVSVLLTVVRWDRLSRADLPTLAGAAILLVVAALRWRKRFAWWEPVLSTAVIGATITCSLVVAQRGYSPGVPSATLGSFEEMSLTVWFLAEPFAALAGAAVSALLAAVVIAVCAAGVDVATRSRLAGTGSEPPSSTNAAPLVVAGLGVLALGRAVQVVVGIVTDDEYAPGLLLAGAGVLAVPLVVAWLVLRRRHSAARRDDRSGEQLDGTVALAQWERWGLLLAGLTVALVDGTTLLSAMAASFGLRGVSQWLFDLRLAGDVLNPVSFLVVATLALAVVDRYRTGRWSVLLLGFAWVFVAQDLATALALPAGSAGVLILASLVAILTGVVLLVRRRLSTRRAVALASVLLLSGLFEFRDAITEPLTTLLALTGVSVSLVVGVVWSLLTDNAGANQDSPSFPRSSRVLLVVANATFGASGIALLALQGGVSTTGLDRTEALGDSQLGFSLIVVVLLLQLMAVWSAPGGTASTEPVPEPAAYGVGSGPEGP